MNGCPRFLFSKKREKLLGLVSKTGKIISSLYSFIIIVLINITIIMIMIFLRWLNWFDVHNCEHNLSWNLYCRILLILPWPTHGDDDDFDYYSVDNFDDDDFDDNLDGNLNDDAFDDNFYDFDDDDYHHIFFRTLCPATMGLLTMGAELMVVGTMIQGQNFMVLIVMIIIMMMMVIRTIWMIQGQKVMLWSGQSWG